MRKPSKRRQIELIRFHIQSLRGDQEALRRKITRLKGRVPRHSTKERDEERLRDIYQEYPPETVAECRERIKSYDTIIQHYRDKQACIQHEIDSQLPLTPWGMVFALIRAWRKRRKLKHAGGPRRPRAQGGQRRRRLQAKHRPLLRQRKEDTYAPVLEPLPSEKNEFS